MIVYCTSYVFTVYYYYSYNENYKVNAGNIRRVTVILMIAKIIVMIILLCSLISKQKNSCFLQYIAIDL